MENPKPAETKFHLDRVDILRGIAIALVVVYHTMLLIFPGYRLSSYDANGFISFSGVKQLLLNFNPFGQGWMGVSLFLVISGFLIHLIYLRSGKPFNAAGFYSRRFWRIYPPYLIILLFFFVANIDTNRSGLVSHLFFFHNLSSKDFFSINPSFWSIAMEVQLYLIYPLLLFIVRKTSMQSAFFFTIGVFLVLRIIAWNRPYEPVYDHNVFMYWFVWCSGAFLAERYLNNKPVFKNAWMWFIGAALLFFASKYYVHTNKFNLLFLTVSFMGLFEIVLYSKFTPRYGLSLLMRGLTFLGVCSYSLYLIHQPYLNNLLDFFRFKSNSPVYLLITVFFVYAILVLLSYSSYKLIELNSVALGNYFRKRRK